MRYHNTHITAIHILILVDIDKHKHLFKDYTLQLKYPFINKILCTLCTITNSHIKQF